MTWFAHVAVAGAMLLPTMPAAPANGLVPPNAALLPPPPKELTVEQLIERGSTYAKRNEWLFAIEDFTSALRLDPKSAKALSKRAEANLYLDRYQEAMADSNECLRLDPNDVVAYRIRGVVKLWKITKGMTDIPADGTYVIKDVNGVLEDLNTAIRLNPATADAYVNRSAIWLIKRDYPQAITDATIAIRLNPGIKTAWTNLGCAKYQNGDFTGSIRTFTTAIRLDPENGSHYRQRGMAKAALKDWVGAVDDFTTALKHDPSDHKALELLAWMRAACPDDQIRNSQEAERLGLQLAQVHLARNSQPVSREFVLFAAIAAETGDFATAVKSQQKALDYQKLTLSLFLPASLFWHEVDFEWKFHVLSATKLAHWQHQLKEYEAKRPCRDPLLWREE